MPRNLAELMAEAQGMGVALPEGRLSKDQIMDLLVEAKERISPPALPALETIYPQLAQNANDLDEGEFQDILHNPDYAIEPKLDGMRGLSHFCPGGMRVTSRRRSDVTCRLTEFGDVLQHLTEGIDPEAMKGTVLDNEALSANPHIPRKSPRKNEDPYTNDILNATVTLCNQDPEGSIRIQKEYGHLRLHAFDILRLRGRNVTGEPDRVRREMVGEVLEYLSARNPHWHLIERQIGGDKMAFYRKCVDRGQEGAMFKNLSAKYKENKRVWAWVKLKETTSEDVFISGFIPGEEGRHFGKVGAFLISALNEKTGEKVELGRVTPGDDALHDQVTAPDGTLRREYYDRVIEVRTQLPMTKNMRFRHPALLRWRPDRSWDTCRINMEKMKNYKKKVNDAQGRP